MKRRRFKQYIMFRRATKEYYIQAFKRGIAYENGYYQGVKERANYE